jgi:hypothetical protein
MQAHHIAPPRAGRAGQVTIEQGRCREEDDGQRREGGDLKTHRRASAVEAAATLADRLTGTG